jgi:hypothetical protein
MTVMVCIDFYLYCFFHDSKLGVPIKTTISATVLEEALNGVVDIRPLSLGEPISRKVRYLFWFVCQFL